MKTYERWRNLAWEELLWSLFNPFKNPKEPVGTHVVLQRTWELLDGKTGCWVIVPSGHYLLEKIDNPFGYKTPWYVLVGTHVGMAVSAWIQWINLGTHNWGDSEIFLYDGERFPLRRTYSTKKIPSMIHVHPLLQEEVDALAQCQSEDEWTSVCARITRARDGAFPPDWHARVMIGLKQKTFKNFA